MKYSIITTCDESYFPHLKILVNSILDKCDLTHINKISIIDNGLTYDQIKYLKDKSNIINIITTGIRTNFNGGTWGKDWQQNVKGKTVYLYDIACKSHEPLLMLDADMMITKDLYSLLDNGGDLQVCVRPGNSVKYIGSYFFIINPKKCLPFIQEWKDLTQNSTGSGAHESPALTKTVEKYKNLLNIIEINQNTVNRIEYPPLDETIIVHFKGSSLHDTFEEQFNNRIKNRANGAWNLYTNKYLN
jgi:hypothetical protein